MINQNTQETLMANSIHSLDIVYDTYKAKPK